MDCYIASDSGNVYIADAVGVPVVLLFGPCCHYEQRPLGNVMLIGNDDNICSYVFETRYYFPQEREALFSVTDPRYTIFSSLSVHYPKPAHWLALPTLKETNFMAF